MADKQLEIRYTDVIVQINASKDQIAAYYEGNQMLNEGSFEDVCENVERIKLIQLEEQVETSKSLLVEVSFLAYREHQRRKQE